MKSKHLPKTLLFNVLCVNIWAIFNIFPKTELLIPLYNIKTTKTKTFIPYFHKLSQRQCSCSVVFPLLENKLLAIILKCFVPEPNINIHIGKMFYNESLASMKSITAKEKLEFIFKSCDWLPIIPYQVEVLANNRH